MAGLFVLSLWQAWEGRAYEYGLKNLHLMGYPVHGLSFDNDSVGSHSLIPQSISQNFTKCMIHLGCYVIKV